MNLPTRRDLLKLSGATGAAFAAGASSLGAATMANGPLPKTNPSRLKIVATGAHPDDPESGCGGTLAKFAEAGHEIVILYLTIGGAKLIEEGSSTLEKNERARREEVSVSNKILNARPVFWGQPDGDTFVNRAEYDRMEKWLWAEAPDLVFTHWPIDAHRDHRATSVLIAHAWRRLPKPCPLYYYEVLTGAQTQCFKPDTYVDITAYEKIKREACYSFATAKPDDWYPQHEEMHKWRGKEHFCPKAEAFVCHDRSRTL